MTGGSPVAAPAAGAAAAAGGFSSFFGAGFPVGGLALAADTSLAWTPLATTPGALHTANNRHAVKRA